MCTYKRGSDGIHPLQRATRLADVTAGLDAAGGLAAGPGVASGSPWLAMVVRRTPAGAVGGRTAPRGGPAIRNTAVRARRWPVLRHPALGHTPAIWWTEGLTRAGTWPDQPPGPGRSKGVRIFLTLLIALGPLVLLVVAVAGLTWTVNPADYPTDAAYQTAVDNRTGLATALMYLAYFVGYAVLATKVSFRWFDSLCLLIPIYSIIWQFRIAHRIAYLPHRDWQPRPDEVKSRSGSGPQRASGF